MLIGAQRMLKLLGYHKLFNLQEKSSLLILLLAIKHTFIIFNLKLIHTRPLYEMAQLPSDRHGVKRN